MFKVGYIDCVSKVSDTGEKSLTKLLNSNETMAVFCLEGVKSSLKYWNWQTILLLLESYHIELTLKDEEVLTCRVLF